MGLKHQRLQFVAAAVGVCMLLGSSREINRLSRAVFSRSSITFSNFTLAITPQQFYGRAMSRSTMNHFFPFTSRPIDGPKGFGPGAITLPVAPLGYYVLHDIKWEYAGFVFTTTPHVFTYKACFTHRREIKKAITSERCLVTLSEAVEIEPLADGSGITVRRTVTDLTPNSPIAGVVANLIPMHMELHHKLALARDWDAA
jgi:hypothetical protein